MGAFAVAIEDHEDIDGFAVAGDPVRRHRVELGCFAGLHEKLAITEHNSGRSFQHVQPVSPWVNLLLGLATLRRRDPHFRDHRTIRIVDSIQWPDRRTVVRCADRPNDYVFLVVIRKHFVDRCHQAGIGVLLDWVPGHFPKDAHGLARFDGTALYEHADPRQAEQPDWGTLVFNYSRHEVRNFLLSNALFWLEEYHIDGLRVDAVASMLYLDYSRQEGQWVPNRHGGHENLDAIDFLQRLNTLTHSEHPGTITAAEESTSFAGVSRPVHLGGLGFTYKWNMGWMHDVLQYTHTDPVYRQWSQNQLTFSILYNDSENFILPFSHDEVVHGKGAMLDKMAGDAWQKRATLRVLYGFMLGHPGKKLLFMGSEFGQWREWNHDRSLDWHLHDDPAHQGLRRYVQELNRLLRSEPALYDNDYSGTGFRWIDCSDNANSIVSLIRTAQDASDFVVMAFNFTPVPRHGYRLGVPSPGFYAELLNSDAALFGGSDLGTGGGVSSEPVAAHGFEHSLQLTLPPLGCLLLKAH